MPMSSDPRRTRCTARPIHGDARDASHDGPSVQRRQTSGGFAGTSVVAIVTNVMTQRTGKVGEMLFISSIMGSRPPVAQRTRDSLQMSAAEAATITKLMPRPQ